MGRRRVPTRPALLLGAVVTIAVIEPAAARPVGPILHEPIPPDPREDLALNVVVDGDLPAALDTPSGIAQAPDPRQPPLPSDSTYGPGSDHETFVSDRETRRPDVGPYDDPFTPRTAPFKRLQAFDAVASDYRLYVRDEHLVEVPTGASPGPNDEAFYADLVVDVASDRSVRIPSVGPGARVVRAHLGAGSRDVTMRVMRDGADNWFLQIHRARGVTRARLVMAEVIARGAFGGEFGDPTWSDLLLVPPLPANVAREATAVRSAIGITARMRPRQAIAKLVQYFRGFAYSDEPPSGRGSVYLDLALSKKGVCRHRAFAFLVTAQGLGIPTRMIVNEAHAWVEVHDGTFWRRIDLGGAGRMAAPPSDEAADRAVHEPPPDVFAWPQNAQRGRDMVTDARARTATSGSASSGPSGSPSMSAEKPGPPSGAAPAVPSSVGSPPPAAPDDRPTSSLSLAVAVADAHRGQPLHVHGDVRADGEPCSHVAIELWLRAAGTPRAYPLGTLATGEDGAFAGGLVVSADAPLGEYDVIARTTGDRRCGTGNSD